MSDFLLSEIAPYVEKDARTLRRWCERGHIPCAYRRPGERGHWRIRAESRKQAIAAVEASRPPNTRRRRENSYPPGAADWFYRGTLTPRQAWRTLPAEELSAATTAARSLGLRSNTSAYRDKLTRARVLQLLVQDLRAQRDSDAIANVRDYDEQQRLRAILKFCGADMAKAVLSAEDGSEAARKIPRLTAGRLAAMIGISRRTFYRWFPGWRSLVFGDLAVAPKAVKIGQEQTGAPIYEFVQTNDDSIDGDNYNAAG